MHFPYLVWQPRSLRQPRTPHLPEAEQQGPMKMDEPAHVWPTEAPHLPSLLTLSAAAAVVVAAAGAVVVRVAEVVVCCAGVVVVAARVVVAAAAVVVGASQAESVAAWRAAMTGASQRPKPSRHPSPQEAGEEPHQPSLEQQAPKREPSQVELMPQEPSTDAFRRPRAEREGFSSWWC